MSGVRLPKAVRALGEASDRALAELKKQSQGEGDPNAGFGESATDTDPTPTEEASNQAADPATPEAGEGETSSEFVDWQAEATAVRAERDKTAHALQTLQGKYRAEVPRLHDEIRELKRTLEDLKTAPQSQTATPAQLPAEMEAKLASLKEAYGDDIADVINLAVSQAVGQSGKAVDSFRQEMEPRLRTVDEYESRAASTGRDAMFNAIEAKHSDWEQINELSTFHAFLDERLPGSTMTRQEAINEAQNANDPEPIIYQLSQFKRRAKTGNSRLESQAVPGDSGRTNAGPQRDEKIYSLAEISKFRVEVGKQKSRGLPLTDTQKRLEASYDMALMEGRAV